MLLLDRWRERAPGALAGADEAAAESALQQGLGAARARWPQIACAEDALVDGLVRHAPANLDELRSINFPELILAGACRRSDRAALAEADARLTANVPRWIPPAARAHADEVRQILLQKLFSGAEPRIEQYTGRRALDAWLRVAAIRCALDLQEAQEPGGPGELEDLWNGPEPELDAAKVLDGHKVRAVLRDALHSLPYRERLLLKLHYLKGVSLDKLAAMERVHRATIVRRLADARGTALERIRAALSERLAVSGEDGESLLRFVRSRLDQSLRRALESNPGDT